MPTLKYLDPITGTYKAVSGSPGPSPTSPPPSGVWGTPPLDVYGTDQLTGTEIYTDSAGKLRGRPQLLGGSKEPTDGVLTYPVGMSLYYIGGSNTTWPPGAAGLAGGALLVTQRHANNAGAQWCYWYGTVTKAWMRHAASSTAWSPWVKVVDNAAEVNAGAATTIIVPNATNFTLVDSVATVRGNTCFLRIAGTMKVASSAPGTTGDITNLALGTLTTEYFPFGSGASQYAMSSVGSGRPINGYALGLSGTVGIGGIGGSAALAIGETVSLAGSYPLL